MVRDSYTVKTLRNAVADYLEAHSDIYNTMRAAAESAIDSGDETEMNRYSYMIEPKTNNIKTLNETAATIRLSFGETTTLYWADSFAVSASENIFNIKLVLITNTGNNKFQNGARIVNKHTQQVGTILQYNSFADITVKYDDKDAPEKINNNYIKLVQPYYTVYCSDSSSTTIFDKFAFMYYSNDNHYEAIYKSPATYIFKKKDIPEYIIYMIYRSCYEFRIGSKDKSEYYNTTLRDDLENIYMPQKGGSPSVNIITYKISIDLELYPGNSIPVSQSAVLGCQTRYEKIRKAYSDIFGYNYIPKQYVPPPTNRFTKKGGSHKQKRTRKNYAG